MIRPTALVLLGATAAKSLLGSSFRLTAGRGRRLDCDLAAVVLATIHPSAILRIRSDDARHEQRQRLAGDLRAAVEASGYRADSIARAGTSPHSCSRR